MDMHTYTQQPPEGFRLLEQGDTITADTIFWSLSEGRWKTVAHFIGDPWRRQINPPMAVPNARSHAPSEGR